MSDIAGRILLASPVMDDSFFSRTVIAMIDHGDEGSMGIVLNHPTPVSLSEAWERVEDEPCHRDAMLRQGGPVDGPLMVIHNHESLADRKLGGGLFLTSSQEMVRSIVSDEMVLAVFFVGYAGWGGGQLDAELSRTSWVIGPDIGPWLLSREAEPDESLWVTCMRAVDASLGRLAENPDIVPDDPSLN